MNKENWSLHTQSEVNWWQSWTKSQGLQWHDDYVYRLDPKCKTSGLVKQLLDSQSVDENYKILDVGSGPITCLGKYHNETKLNITAVDALAHQYDSLDWGYSRPEPLTQYCETEQLLEMFEQNSFDLVHARNCLDHHYDALLSIKNMMQVLKKNGLMVLIHAENEAWHNRWEGLHQWNFFIQGKDLKISDRKQAYSITELISPMGEIIINQRVEGRMLETVVRKK